jgi:hypothetical protein
MCNVFSWKERVRSRMMPRLVEPHKFTFAWGFDGSARFGKMRNVQQYD